MMNLDLLRGAADLTFLGEQPLKQVAAPRFVVVDRLILEERRFLPSKRYPPEDRDEGRLSFSFLDDLQAGTRVVRGLDRPVMPAIDRVRTGGMISRHGLLHIAIDD